MNGCDMFKCVGFDVIFKWLFINVIFEIVYFVNGCEDVVIVCVEVVCFVLDCR